MKEEIIDPYSTWSYPVYHLKPEDLPCWFVYGYIYKSVGYISARGVKYLVYVPNYRVEKQLFKNDNLLVSYKKEIQPVVLGDDFKWYTGYDHVLDGSIISSFIEAVAKFSDYDISEIRSMVIKKNDWYH